MSVEDIRQGIATGSAVIERMPIDDMRVRIAALGPSPAAVLLEHLTATIRQLREDAGQAGLLARSIEPDSQRAHLHYSMAVSGSSRADAIDMIGATLTLQDAGQETISSLTRYREEATAALGLLASVGESLERLQQQHQEACGDADNTRTAQTAVLRFAAAYSVSLGGQ